MKSNRGGSEDVDDENGHKGAALRALPEALDPSWDNPVGEFRVGEGLHTGTEGTKSATSQFLSDSNHFWASANTIESSFTPSFSRVTDAERTQAMNSWLTCLASPYANDYISLQDISSNLTLSNDALRLPSAVSLLMQVERFPRPTTTNYYTESVLHSGSRSLQLLPSVSAFPQSTSGLSMKSFKGDHVDVKGTMDEKDCITNLDHNSFESVEADESETSKVTQHQIFSSSERCHNLELDLRDLQIVLCKELTKSDVGSIGRIVLPKKEAEAYLPPLFERDGMILHMDDLTLPVRWKFKYRYWPNNKSRMYVLETTGDFVRAHGLQTGDSFIVYGSSTGNYVVSGKKVGSMDNPFDVLPIDFGKQSSMS